MKILAGSSSKSLAQAISQHLQIPLTQSSVRRFADMEIFVEVLDNVRGEDVFVVQSTCCPANDHVMELLITLDALRRSSARRVTAVIPYYGYSRQDRKTAPRTPISAKLIANMLTTAGADRVLTVDLHSGQIQGFFDIPADNLMAAPVFARDIRNLGLPLSEMIIVSPDVGGVVRARHLAERLGIDLAIVDKRRKSAGISEVVNIIGTIKDRHCILIDDIADSAGTLCNAAEALMQAGAKSVRAYVSHGVLSGSATERIIASPLTELVVTDSITMTEQLESVHKIRSLSIAPLLAEAIRRINAEKSLSSLFE